MAVEVKELFDSIVEIWGIYSDRFGIIADKQYALLKLFEEVGELSEAVLIQNGRVRPEKLLAKRDGEKLIGHELSDILGTVVLLAHLYEIDLQESVREKWLDKKNADAQENEK